MGCGSSSVNTVQNVSFTIHYCIFFPCKDEDKLKITRRAKEVCNIKENLSIVKYIYTCAKKNPLFKELIKKEETLRNCVYFIIRKNAKSRKSYDYKYVFSYIPFRDLDNSDSDFIQTIYILDINFSNLKIPRDKVLRDLEKISDLNIVDKFIDISGLKVFNIIPEEIKVSKNSIYKDIIEDNGIEEPAIKGGITIEIHSELDENLLTQILEKFKPDSPQKVTTISIKNNKFSQIDLYIKLFEALITCKTLRNVVISNNPVPTGFDMGCNLITKLFKLNKNIRNVNLSNNFIYTKYLIRILKEGLNGSKLYKLDIGSNFLTYAGCQHLAEWLHYHRTLRVLNLQLNSALDFKREGSELILEELKYPINFLSLDLSYMVLTGFGSKMANFIINCLSLKELKIQNVSMNKEDIELICDAIVDSKSIVYLNISENSNSNDVAVKFIADMIEKNKSIKMIDLDKMNLTSKNFNFYLKQAIEKNDKIQDFSFNGNSQMKFEDLYEVFVNRKNLKHLSFKAVLIKDEDQITLVNKLRESRKDVIIQVDNP